MSGSEPGLVRECARRTGDLGEAVGLLAARLPGAEARPGLALLRVATLFERLAASGQRASKLRDLAEAFADATPLEIKYLAKAFAGSLRVGAQAGVMEGALARAFDASVEDIRHALALVTDPGVVAVLARDGKLSEAKMSLGRPIAFMLATPIETLNVPIDPSAYVVEEKIDGVRAQVHKLGNEVTIFARGLDPMTTAFPEIVDAFRFVRGNIALDGEVVAVGPSGRPRPFQSLQGRLRRLAPSKRLLDETPVCFVAYDILFEDDHDLLARPWSERRTRLEALRRNAHPRGDSAFIPLHG